MYILISVKKFSLVFVNPLYLARLVNSCHITTITKFKFLFKNKNYISSVMFFLTHSLCTNPPPHVNSMTFSIKSLGASIWL